MSTVDANEELRVALERGDPAGPELLVTQFGDRAYRLALRITGRAAVVLRDVEGLSNHEVSAVLGITLANVETRVHRARLFLRKRLSRYLGDEPVAGSLSYAFQG